MKVQVLVTWPSKINPDILRRNWNMIEGWRTVFKNLLVTRLVLDVSEDLHPDRIERYCVIRNRMLDLVEKDAEVVVMVDSDIVSFHPQSFQFLVGDCIGWKAICAPTIVQDRNPDKFYDTWGFVRKGKHLTHEAPYSQDILEPNTVSVQMDSVGCLYAMPVQPIHAGVRYTKVEGHTDHMGICKEYRYRGYSIIWSRPLVATHVNLTEYGEEWH